MLTIINEVVAPQIALGDTVSPVIQASFRAHLYCYLLT